MAAQLRLAKLHPNKPQDSWNNALLADETKIEMFGCTAQRHAWRKTKRSISAQMPHTSYQARWRRGDAFCLFCSHTGNLVVIKSTMNSSVCQSIPESNVRPSVRQLKCGQNWFMQQDSDHKHTSKFTTERQKRKRIKVLECPSQSPDLNLCEMLLWDLKRAVHKQIRSKLSELM